jgi:hypothetical protein
MANTFWRKPTAGGDLNAWAPYNDAQTDSAISLCTSRLFYDAGTLKLSKGKIGIDNGTKKGICLIDTETTISIAALTNSQWAKIEIAISGTSVVISATSLGAGTYPIPAAFTGAYNAEKGGFHITTTKRCIGVIYKYSDALHAIVNVDADTYWCSYFNGLEQKRRGSGFAIPIGDWNMDSTALVTFANPFSILWSYLPVKAITAFIIADSDAAIGPAAIVEFSARSPDGIWLIYNASVVMSRTGGGYFDNADFNATSWNRGYIYIQFLDL